ncbi:pyocin knob domain-containing protein [Marinomonas spartinae]|uniref:pyocin knob domain-containing protein n=1 Tax=Marinomonas spartinae TaxID=1792290 RepID=UPI0018F1EF09|nr:pyocin knob domain-containing protein [Marinomonas spartinae]MBJ7556562.1 hypothetical protein [Marinomonas spartinae]
MSVGQQSSLNDLLQVNEKASEAQGTANAAKEKADKAFAQASLSRGTVNIGVLMKLDAKLNSLTKSGFFFVDGGYVIRGDQMNAPTMSPAFMCVVSSDATEGRIVQTVTPYDHDEVYTRRFSREHGWGVWFEHLTTVNTITDANGFIKAA